MFTVLYTAIFNSSVSLFSLFELIKETKKKSTHVHSKLPCCLSRIKISVMLSLGVSFHSCISAASFFSLHFSLFLNSVCSLLQIKT